MDNVIQSDLQCIQAVIIRIFHGNWKVTLAYLVPCSTSWVTAQLISYQQIYIKQMEWEWKYASWPMKLSHLSKPLLQVF